MDIIEEINRMKMLSDYDPKTGLNENKETNNFKTIDEGYKERKEDFRKRHQKANSFKEKVMECFYGIPTNDNKPVLIERVTLDRVLKKHGTNGMINISANRSDMSQERNDEKTRELIEDIKQSGFFISSYIWRI